MQADGTILIDTSISEDGFVKGTKDIELAAKRMAKSVSGLSAKASTAFQKQLDNFVKQNDQYAAQQKKIESLQKKVSDYKVQKEATQEYAAVGKEIDGINKKLESVIKRQERFVSTGGNRGSRTFQGMEYDIEQLATQLKEAQARKKQLEDSDKAYTLKIDTEEGKRALEQLEREEQKLDNMGRRLETSFMSLKQKILNYGGSLDVARIKTTTYTGILDSTKYGLQTVSNALRGIPGALKSAPKAIFGHMISQLKILSIRANDAAINLAKLAGNGIIGGLKKISNGIFGINKSANKTTFGLKQMIKTALLMGSIYSAISFAISGVNEGFQNLAQYSDETNNTLSTLMSSLTQLKNALATAFSPILTVIAPALNYLINLVTAAATAVAQLMAALTGKDTFVKATKVQQDYAASLDETAGAAKDAEGALASFDKLNVMSENNFGGGGLSPDDMFETVPVESATKDLADKIKSIFDRFFEPIKTSWDKYGAAAIKAAQRALKSLGDTARDIGRDFLQVWADEGYGEKISADLIQTFTNLANTVGNLSDRFREAWNANDNGLNIMRRLLGIVSQVTDFFKQASQSLEEWSAQLNLVPLLDSIVKLLGSIEPIVENIKNALLFILDEVILPLSSFVIENGLPAFLDLVSAALDVLNATIEALKPAWTWFWNNVLEPAAGAVGEVLINALGFITDKLTDLSDWITDHQELISTFITIIAGLGAAFVAVNGAIGLVAGILPTIISLVSTLAPIVSGLITVLTGPVGLVLAIGAIVTAAGEGQQMIDSLKLALGGLIDFISGVFTGDWEKAWEGIKNIVKGVFGVLLTIAESTLKLIGDLLQGVVDKISDVAKKLTDFAKTLPSYDEFYSGEMDLSGLAPRSASANPEVHLPHLASGTVVPPRAGEFAAILGDNKQETEVVSPLSIIEQALDRVMRKYGAGMGAGANFSGAVYIDKKELGRSMVEFIREEKKRTGKNPVLV